jgi:hypothetical protein
MKRQNIYTVALCGLLGASLLSGCGSAGAGTAGQTATGQTLTIATTADGGLPGPAQSERAGPVYPANAGVLRHIVLLALYHHG